MSCVAISMFQIFVFRDETNLKEKIDDSDKKKQEKEMEKRDKNNEILQIERRQEKKEIEIGKEKRRVGLKLNKLNSKSYSFSSKKPKKPLQNPMLPSKSIKRQSIN